MPHYVGRHNLKSIIDSMRPETKTLVIDDVRVFNFPAHYARTSDEAIKAIRDEGPWDYVYWDHDLGTHLDETITIYPVLMFVLEAAFYGTPYQLGTCFIHTDNPVGRETLNQLNKHYEVIHIDASGILGKQEDNNEQGLGSV